MNLLLIRNKQLKELKRGGVKAKIVDMCKNIRLDFPQKTSSVSDNKLIRVVTQIVDRSQAFGIITIGDIYVFLRLSFKLGEDFLDIDYNNWMKELLFKKDHLSISNKLQQLHKKVFNPVTCEVSNDR